VLRFRICFNADPDPGVLIFDDQKLKKKKIFHNFFSIFVRLYASLDPRGFDF
jgi:hypothetical protein